MGVASSLNDRHRQIRRLRNVVWWMVLVSLFVWTVLPLMWSLSASFKTPIEVYRTPPTLIPRQPTLDAYVRAFRHQGFPRYFANSVYLTVSSTLITLAVSVLAGYAFARYAFRFRSVLLMLILVPRILPRAALVVPLYQIFASLRLLDTYFVLILTYTATAVPLSTWVLTGFFQKIPKELEESALIDGAGFWRILISIIIPIALPGILTSVVVAVVQAWNEFPFVLAFTTSSSMRTLPYQLYMLRDSLGLQDWPMLNAFTIITIIPIVALYLRFEDRVVSGILSGALKE